MRDTEGKISIEYLPDGSLKVDASKLKGEDADLLEELRDLATEIGGDLKVEKHVLRHGHSHSTKNHHHH